MGTADESCHKSYQDALEAEIQRWRGYENALRKGDREAFSELMDMCRAYALEGNHAPNPFVFEPMIISILLLQQKRLNQIEKKLGIKSPFGNPEPPRVIQLEKNLQTLKPETTQHGARPNGQKTLE